MANGPAVVGRYALVGRLASGGMGIVYRARLSSDGGFVRDFALKRLHPHIADDDEAVQMLLDEARLAALIRHPNVVTTLDVGSDADGFYVVMELVEGSSLSDLVEKAGALSPRIATRIVLDVLEGLSAAHLARDEHGRELEIVHRDVSPANVLVGRDGVAKLTDFGVAKARARLRTTVGVEVKGKLGYMPPEQLEGDLVDARADLFATAVVLWELLRGERLLRPTRARLKELERSAETPCSEPSWFATGAGDALDGIIRRGLRRAPEARFESARAMIEALRAAAHLGAGIAEAHELASIVAASERGNAEHACPTDGAPSRPTSSVGPSPRPESTDVVTLDAAWSSGNVEHARAGGVREATLVIDARPVPRAARGSRRRIALAIGALALAGCAMLAIATHRAGASAAPRVKEAHAPALVAASGDALPSGKAESTAAVSPADGSSMSMAPAELAASANPTKRGAPPRRVRTPPTGTQSAPGRGDDPFGGRH